MTTELLVSSFGRESCDCWQVHCITNIAWLCTSLTSHHTPMMQNDVIHSYKEHSLRGQPRNTVFDSGWVVKRQDLIPANLVRLTYSSQRQTLNLPTAILCDSVHIPIPYLGARSHGMHGHTNGVWVTEAVTSHSWLRWFPNSNPG